MEAAAGHEQRDGQQAHSRGGEEARGQPSVARRAVQQWGEHDGEADDQAGVGRAGVRDAVRLKNQDSSLGYPQQAPDAHLVPRVALRPSAGGDEGETRDRGDRVPREEHHQDRQGVGGGLRGQVAGAPDDGDKEEHCVSAAGVEHPLKLHCFHSEAKNVILQQC